MKIKTEGSQLLSIPNTPEGLAFYEQFKGYLNRTIYKVHYKGRGSRKSHGNKSDLPLRYSEWFAVYLTPGYGDYIATKSSNNFLSNENRILLKHNRELEAAVRDTQKASRLLDEDIAVLITKNHNLHLELKEEREQLEEVLGRLVALNNKTILTKIKSYFLNVKQTFVNLSKIRIKIKFERTEA